MGPDTQYSQRKRERDLLFSQLHTVYISGPCLVNLSDSRQTYTPIDFAYPPAISVSLPTHIHLSYITIYRLLHHVSALNCLTMHYLSALSRHQLPL